MVSENPSPVTPYMYTCVLRKSPNNECFGLKRHFVIAQVDCTRNLMITWPHSHVLHIWLVFSVKLMEQLHNS